MRSRLNWAGHMERIGDENLAKRAEVQKVEGNGGEEDRDCDGRSALERYGKSGRRMENNSKT